MRHIGGIPTPTASASKVNRLNLNISCCSNMPVSITHSIVESAPPSGLCIEEIEVAVEDYGRCAWLLQSAFADSSQGMHIAVQSTNSVQRR
eukprot:CAMPEP_0115872360 /NCGR_PEP_ID=MMETSP0287-20121206/23379_1 /TAXON_ID=412157 /ORGANISM="Chrysochromulina rotalis, Strain UIO044" /LENGTH=90 /DNA_ID=CAMNT_0003327265 /DNA_START=724 /DNA_END=993 /DNA_ORIENTATION=-